MKFRFSLMGMVFWALGAFLIVDRGYHWNFVIPVAVGTFLFLYGLFSR